MDIKNVIAAISLSAAVIILYSLFFQPAPDPNRIKKDSIEKTKVIESDAPSIEQNENFSKLTRAEALNESKRIKFENDNIIGSINIGAGATIDDLTFKQYNTKLDSNEKIVLLNPRKVENGYLIETGFVTNNKNIDVPNASTKWKVVGNQKLTNNNPVKLIWSNSQGIKFEKNISIDDKFLFIVEQKIINNSEKTYNFYPYGQVIRNTAPEVTNFYILHEGLLGVFDG